MFIRRKAIAAVAVITAPVLGILAVPTLVEAALSNDIQPVARVALTIDGYDLAIFERCIGLGSESEVDTSPTQGDEEVILRRLPGDTTGRTVCEGPLTNSMELAAWREAVVLGDLAAAVKDVSVVMYRADGEPQFRWHLENAWPSGLTHMFEDGTGSQIVTLTYDNVQRVAP